MISYQDHDCATVVTSVTFVLEATAAFVASVTLGLIDAYIEVSK